MNLQSVSGRVAGRGILLVELDASEPLACARALEDRHSLIRTTSRASASQLLLRDGAIAAVVVVAGADERSWKEAMSLLRRAKRRHPRLTRILISRRLGGHAAVVLKVAHTFTDPSIPGDELRALIDTGVTKARPE